MTTALLLASALLALGDDAAMHWRPAPLDILPAPKSSLATGRQFALAPGAEVAIVAAAEGPIVQTAADVAQRCLAARGFRVHRVPAEPWPKAELVVHLGQPACKSSAARLLADRPQVAPPKRNADQSYVLRVGPNPDRPGQLVAVVAGGGPLGTLYGTYTLLKSLTSADRGLSLPEILVADGPVLAVRGLSPQWAWYIGERGPYDAALWDLQRWKQAVDLLAEYRFNMLALCTYGKFPFPLDRYRQRCAVDLPFELWSPEKGTHTIRWTHPAYRDDFLGQLVDYAHRRGIRVLIYSCLNLQDEVGSHRWTDPAEIACYTDVIGQVLRRYGVDGFIFESGEFLLTHPADVAEFGRDRWSRLRGDIYLTRRYAEVIRQARPDAVLGLVDHYLFRDWDEKGVPQREGLARWKQELPPEAIVAYVHTSEAYEVFEPQRVWTYVFGPKGGLKPMIQLHLADFCDVPRGRAAGAYFVTYDWVPHEASYLCFAQSAWGNYSALQAAEPTLLVHSSESGVGGPIARRTWQAIKRDLYGPGADFGEGLLTAARATFQGMWDPRQVLRSLLLEKVLPCLESGRLTPLQKMLSESRAGRATTEQGLAMMQAARPRAQSSFLCQWPLEEHLEKAICLARTQLAWLDFVAQYTEAALDLARRPADDAFCAQVLGRTRAAALANHGRIRQALARAYFSYPHDKLGKFEFLAAPEPLLDDLARVRASFRVACGASGRLVPVKNVSRGAKVVADSVYEMAHYDPKFTIDGARGTPSRGVWVSKDTPGEHFLEVRFDRPQPLRGLIVDWVRDATRDWVAADFRVEIGRQGKFQSVLEARDNRQPSAVVAIDPPREADALRVVILRGSPHRPRLGAIEEIQVLAEKGK